MNTYSTYRSVGRFFVVLACIAACWILSEENAHAQSVTPMQVAQETPGFKAAMNYADMGKGESVNPFNGGLVVSHPSAIALPQNLGAVLRPVRVYNNKEVNSLFVQAIGSDMGIPHGWVGMNWTLGYGKVFLRIRHVGTQAGTYVSRAEYFYQDESGAEHRLYFNAAATGNPTGIPGIEPFITDDQKPREGFWYFTNDGSYLRARYYEASNHWVIYFPDGSLRHLGGSGSGAYNPPQVGHPSVGAVVKNHYVHGWYTTDIEDRAGNTVHIEYYSYDVNAHRPYGGMIHYITDHFGRTVTFDIFALENSPDVWKYGLLKSISYSSNGHPASELYDYTQVVGNFPPLPEQMYPMLSSVKDPVQLETLYAYDSFFHDSVRHGSFLTRIDYPTGGTSTYTYGYWLYFIQRPMPNGNEPITDEGNTTGVTSHSLYLRRSDGNDNVSTWTWSREFGLPVEAHSYWFGSIRTVAVVETDPIGRQTAHFYSCPGQSGTNDLFPLGLQIEVLKYREQIPFNTENINANKVFEQHWKYGHKGGDADNCREEYYENATYPPLGNSRPQVAKEWEYSSGGAVLTEKETKSYVWDGYGHHMLSLTRGSGIIKPGDPAVAGVAVSASEYEIVLPTDENPALPYQLDRLVYSYSGMAKTIESEPTTWTDDTGYVDPPGSIGVTGEADWAWFQAVEQAYAPSWTYPNSGLLSSRRQLNTKVLSFAVDAGSHILGKAQQAASDRQLTLTYESKDSGNITSTAVAVGSPSSSYAVYYAWDHGMVKSMQWSGIGYPEFEREIDQNTSRISWQKEAGSGRIAQYSYDDIGRLTKIAPPGPDYPTLLSYPLTSITRSLTQTAESSGGVSHTWSAGNRIYFCSGAHSDAPAWEWPAQLFSEDYDIHIAYAFDDLGRLIWTDRMRSPYGGWSRTQTAYDPFGQAVFQSEPHDPGVPHATVDFPFMGGNFKIEYPLNQAPTYGNALGTWSSWFAGATYESPFVGSPDDFNRVRWVIRSDRSQTNTTYAGLTTTVTPYGLNVAAPGGASDPTTYTKDVLGRLLGVDPPAAGASADYSYDGIGNLINVKLTGSGAIQERKFVFDALGQLIRADNPETRTGVTDAGVVDYQYDALGNLLTYTDGVGRAQGYSINRSYDAKGRLRAVNKGTSSLATWTYDSLGGYVFNNRLLATQTLTNTGGNAVRETFSYDEDTGRPLEKKVYTLDITDPDDANVVNWTWDLLGQLVKESAKVGQALPTTFTTTSAYSQGLLRSKRFSNGAILKEGVSEIFYHPSMAIQSITHTNGTTSALQTSFEEDPSTPRIKSITALNPNNPSDVKWQSGAYSYDGAGNITYMGNDHYVYDALNRLIEATVLHPPFGTPVTSATMNYTYDSYGNLYNRAVSGMDGTNFAFQAAVAQVNGESTNRLSNITWPNTPNGITLEYDQNGNMTFQKDTPTGASKIELKYDALNRVSQTILQNDSDTYYYNADGERVVLKHGDGATTYYLRSGAQVLAEQQFTQSGSGQVEKRKAYLYIGPNLAATKETNGASLVTVDAQGNPQAVCPETYAAMAGLKDLPSLSDAALSTNSPYALSQTIKNVPGDVVGVMVRIGRKSGSQYPLDNWNGVPGPDEDEANCKFYLVQGKDAEFVFHGEGLAQGKTYDAAQLVPGSDVQVAMSGLMAGVSYRITLNVWTSLGADTSIGYNKVAMEEGQIFIPTAYAPSFFSLKHFVALPQSGVFEPRLRAFWTFTTSQGFKSFDLAGTQVNGTEVVLNEQPMLSASFEMPVALALAKGLHANSTFILYGNTKTNRLSIASLQGRLVPDTCGGAVTEEVSQPAITACYNLGEDAQNPGHTRVYVHWDPGISPAPLYRIYREIKLCTSPQSCLAGCQVFHTWSHVVGETYAGDPAPFSYYDSFDTPSGAYIVGYRVCAVDGSTEDMSDCVLSSPLPCMTTPIVEVQNLSSGGNNADRKVRLIISGPDISAQDEYRYIVKRRIENPPSETTIAVTRDTDIMDTGHFPDVDNPLAIYDVAVCFELEGEHVIISGWGGDQTKVSSCPTLPTASLTATFDGVQTVHLSWSASGQVPIWYDVYMGFDTERLLFRTGLTTLDVNMAAYEHYRGWVRFHVVAVEQPTGCRGSAYSQAYVPVGQCVPDIPTPSSATARNGADERGPYIDVSWVAPDDPDHIIAGYQVNNYEGASTCAGTPVSASVWASAPARIWGVSDQTAYAFKVQSQKVTGCLSATGPCVTRTTPSYACSPALVAPGVSYQAATQTTPKRLKWAAVGGSTAYVIYEYKASGCQWGQFKMVHNPFTPAQNSGDIYWNLPSGYDQGTYYFRVRAMKAQTPTPCFSPFSLCVATSETCDLTSPVITLIPGEGTVLVNWDAVENATGYQVKHWAGTSACGGTPTDTVNLGSGITSHLFTGLAAGYHAFEVLAYDALCATSSGCHSTVVEPGPVTTEKVYFYVCDHLGSVRFVSDASGTMVSIHDFEPFGVELSPIVNTSQNTHQFTGHERDFATGLDYMHFRYFAASTARFIKQDNIMGEATDPQSFNLYSYVNNRPVNFNDPTGHLGPITHWHQMIFQAMAKTSAVPVTVYVLNYSNLSNAQVGAIKDEVTHIFGKTPIQISFVDIPLSNLQTTWQYGKDTKKLNIMQKLLPRLREKNLSASALGSGGVKPGENTAEIWVDRAKAFCKTTDDSPYLGRALGRDAAHEIGHTLGVSDDESSELHIMKGSHPDLMYWTGARGASEMYFSTTDVQDMLNYLSGP